MDINKTDKMADSTRKQGFLPITNHNATVLILGSMPSEKSLEKHEYYGHPRNGFWRIMQTYTGIEATAPYQKRIAGLHRVGIALWDVIASCYRKGSLDSNINHEKVNPLSDFINEHPYLRFIGLNGGKAFTLFERHFVKLHGLPSSVHYAALPSTSPAYTLPLENKIQQWQSHLDPYV